MGTAWSDLLMEDPHGARSLYGPRKLLPDRYRGMAPEEIAAIRNMQLLQSQRRKVRISPLITTCACSEFPTGSIMLFVYAKRKKMSGRRRSRTAGLRGKGDNWRRFFIGNPN